jgi:hypothetical protein
LEKTMSRLHKLTASITVAALVTVSCLAPIGQALAQPGMRQAHPVHGMRQAHPQHGMRHHGGRGMGGFNTGMAVGIVGSVVATAIIAQAQREAESRAVANDHRAHMVREAE